MIFSVLLFTVGLIVIIYFSERLVESVVGTSLGFGISSFLISVIFIGFDPENLVLGSVATFEQAAGIALGTVVGAAMVAIALALGITAVIVPLKFEKASRKILIIPLLATLLLFGLCFDGILSRVDGIILLSAFILSLLYLIKLSRGGVDIRPEGEVAETLEKRDKVNKWKAFGLMIISLAAIIAGSELVVIYSKDLIIRWGWEESVFGMTVLALLVSFEELARELPAALKGRPEITFGNVLGSILAFFLFNAGIISLVRPVPVSQEVIRFYLPVALITVIFITIFMLSRRITRASGIILIVIYLIFFIGAYIR